MTIQEEILEAFAEHKYNNSILREEHPNFDWDDMQEDHFIKVEMRERAKGDFTFLQSKGVKIVETIGNARWIYSDIVKVEPLIEVKNDQSAKT